MTEGDWQKNIRLGDGLGKGKCAWAAVDLPAGTMIGYCDGDDTDKDTVHSIRLGGRRIDPAEPFRYVSHSCKPNAQFKDKGRWLYALESIRAGDEITIDYLYTEHVISAPFACKCGATTCRGFVCTPSPSEAQTR